MHFETQSFQQSQAHCLEREEEEEEAAAIYAAKLYLHHNRTAISNPCSSVLARYIKVYLLTFYIYNICMLLAVMSPLK